MRRPWLALCFILLLSALAAPVYAQEPPSSARIEGLRHEYQTWCNCGPVNLMMALSYYGWPHDQTVPAAWLKPTVGDKNVSPHEMVAYVNQQPDLAHLRALWRYGGSLTTIRQMIAAGFPIIVESGFQPEGHEWMGHYITVVAYDDKVATIWTYDSYNGYGVGRGEETGYDEFDANWRHFNRVFVVVYPAEREADVLRLLGPLADPASAAACALEDARTEISSGHDDGWAWFNAGTAAVALGRYPEAAAAYARAFTYDLPFRMLWYQFGPYAAYYHTGRYYQMLMLADETEAITDQIEETNVWRGLALAALGRLDDALAQFDRALEFNPNCADAREARQQLVSGTYAAPVPLDIRARSLP